jgi:glutathione S-transferase
VSAEPVLWHIEVSHYSEKARWALDFKGVHYRTRAPQPGAHMAFALALTRGKHRTFPLMKLDGRTIGDSSAIVAALEERFPDPPLYPDDPAELARALELERWFGEELGPHTRLLAWHELIRDPEMFQDVALRLGPWIPERSGRAGAATARRFLGMRYGVGSEGSDELARRKILAALDRLEAELDGADYLVGDRFSVADLAAAALMYPIVLPPEAPPIVDRPPEGMERFREPLKDRPGYRWVEEMFRRHRR